MAYNNLISTAIKAAVKAGRAVMHIYADSADGLTVERKEDNSPVTIADMTSHNIIAEILGPTNLPVLSEEGKQIRWEVRQQWKSFWLVDPLDGTKEFIKRNGEFTVNIALIEDNKPVSGVIYIPVTATLYAGITSEDSWKLEDVSGEEVSFEEMKTRGKKLPCRELPETFTVLESRSHRNHKTKRYIERLQMSENPVDVLPVGSSIKLCMVAEGSAHEYRRHGPTMEWDTAAGHAIANAAGKKMMLTDRSGELTYNKKNLVNPDFIIGGNYV